MQARLALTAAALCGALAVAAVTVDLAYTLTVTIETLDEGGEWRVVQRVPQDDTAYESEPFHGFSGCTGPDVRVVVHNDRPLSAERDVHIAFYNATSGRDTVAVNEQIHMDRMASETFRFTVPPSAFPPENQSDDGRPFPTGPGQTHVNVRVGDLFLGTCATRAAPEAGTGKEAST